MSPAFLATIFESTMVHKVWTLCYRSYIDFSGTSQNNRRPCCTHWERFNAILQSWI